MEKQRKKSDIIVVAAWVTLTTSLLEGCVWVWTRAYPALNAAHKVSLDALWVAPVLNLACFLAFSLLLIPWMPKLARRLGARLWPGLYGLFLFFGISLTMLAPLIFYRLGALMMSLGLAVVLGRQLAGQEEKLTAWLRRRLWCVPVILLLVWLGVRVYGHISESLDFRRLADADANAPNVLILVMDTVRADRFAPNRSPSITPNIDRLAAGGVRFDQAWSSTSWSLPSQVSILTGRYPHEHEADWPTAKLSPRYPTLAELFRQRGYVTGAFSGNAAWVTPEYMGRGFLHFQVYNLENLFRRVTIGRSINRLLDLTGYDSAGRGKKAPQINTEFSQFLQDFPGRPFFAYVCYMDVNQEMYDSSKNQHRGVPQVMKDYDAALSRLDARIGELLSGLQQRGQLENTLLIITSDHGESFGAEETEDHDPPLHGTSLYREQSAVPLIVDFPGRVPSGRISTRTVSIVQIAATILDLLDWKDSPFPGESLAMDWKQPDRTEDSQQAVLGELRYREGQKIQESVTRGTWQYLNTPEDFEQLKKGEELFDLASDPKSKRNLANEAFARPVLSELRERLGMFRMSGAQRSAAELRRRTPHAAGNHPPAP